MLTEAETIEVCNKVRTAGGGNALKALLPSDPGKGTSCLIANGLNFDCEIDYGLHEPWGDALTLLPGSGRMHLADADADTGRRIADEMGWDIEYSGDTFDLVLPDELAMVAVEFDRDLESIPKEHRWVAKYNIEILDAERYEGEAHSEQ